ncbi:hypothetical protein [Bacteroides sp.]
MKKSIILFSILGSSYMAMAQSINQNSISSSELHSASKYNDLKIEVNDSQIKSQLINNDCCIINDVLLKTERFVKPNTEHLVTCFFDMPSDGFIDLDFHWGGSELHKELESELAILYYHSSSTRYYCTVHDLDESHNISIKGIPCSAGSHFLDMQSNTLYVESTVTVTMYKKE